MTQSNEFTNQGQNPLQNNPPPRDRQLTPGQLLEEKYEVMSLIGIGGMGKVYKVRQVFLNKALALKVLDLQQMGELQIRRFQLEAKAAFSLSHPNLVKVFDFGLLDKVEPYLVMDFVDGVTLHEHLKQKGPLTPEQSVKVFVQAASGLAYAHRHQVVHRDIKPSNIMLDAMSKVGANNTVKIVDFGIAKLAESGEVQGLTRTGEIFGSPLYMSPEQCSGEIVDHRSDIYSLGCSLFESLTGTPPHVGNSALRTMMLHQTAAAPYMREASLGSTYPENLEMIVHRMLEKSPADRYQSLDDVVEDLSKALGQVALVSAKTNSVSRAPVVVEGTPGNISMKPLNFAFMIVSVMTLTSVATLGVERLVRHSIKSKAEIAKAVASSAPSVVRKLAEQPMSEADYSDADRSMTKQSEDAAKVFENAPPIKARSVLEDNIPKEQINFPSVCIGNFTNVSFVLPQDEKLVPFLGMAINNQTFVPSKRLRLDLGGQYGQGLKNPKILTKIDPKLFQELTIGPSTNDMFVNISFDHEQQNVQAVKALEFVSGWTGLEGVSLYELDANAKAMEALNNIKNLQYLKILQCTTDVDSMVKKPFLKRLKSLSINGVPCENIISKVANSTKLESLSLADTDISATSLEKLQAAPRLTFLDIRIKNHFTLDEDQLIALTKLKKLEVLSIRDSRLRPKELKYLLENCPDLEKLQLNGDAAEYVKSHVLEDTRIELLQ